MFWFSNKLSPQDSCFILFLTELLISKRDIVSHVLSFELLAWDSNKTAHHGQQFLMSVYWNFMESGISEIEIWLNFWVSASNKLGKVWEEGNLVHSLKKSKGRDKVQKEGQ